MTDADPPGQSSGSEEAATRPGDVPTTRPDSLESLEVLVGDWDMEARFHEGYFGAGSPPITTRGGRTSFEWLEGRRFLVQRFQVDNPDAPSGIAIIGLDESGPFFVQHYFDSRGVARRYHMSLEDDVWRLWREAPGFWQRYEGSVSADGAHIEGAWEMSADGVEWRHDLGLAYLRRP